MSWYYIADGKQIGPLEDADFSRLVSSGVVQAHTLVWNSSMPNWAAFSTVSAPHLPTPPAPAPSPVHAPVEVPGLVRRAQANALGGIGAVIRSSFDLYKTKFGACLGMFWLAYLIPTASGMIPLVGLLAVFFVQPQMTAGLYWCFVRRFRNKPDASLGDIFAGFQHSFGSLALLQLLLFVFALVPIGICVAIIASLHSRGDPHAGVAAALFVCSIALMYAAVRTMFSYLLVVDLGLGAWEALSTSWKATRGRGWALLGYTFLLGLLGISGVLALVIGIIFTLPICAIGIARIYENVFGEKPS